MSIVQQRTRNQGFSNAAHQRRVKIVENRTVKGKSVSSLALEARKSDKRGSK